MAAVGIFVVGGLFAIADGVQTLRRLDLGDYLVSSSDPTPTAVFLEDSAALVGIALALTLPWLSRVGRSRIMPANPG